MPIERSQMQKSTFYRIPLLRIYMEIQMLPLWSVSRKVRLLQSVWSPAQYGHSHPGRLAKAAIKLHLRPTWATQHGTWSLLSRFKEKRLMQSYALHREGRCQPLPLSESYILVLYYRNEFRRRQRGKQHGFMKRGYLILPIPSRVWTSPERRASPENKRNFASFKRSANCFRKLIRASQAASFWMK